MSNLEVLASAPILVVQLVVNGILVGAIFALVAYGMALVWGVMNIINIAQGELVMVGGYVVFYLDGAGVHPWLGIPIAAVAMYVLGLLLYRGVIRRLVDRDMFVSILATFGISILLQQLANQLFGADIRTLPTNLPSLSFAEGLVSIASIRIVAFAAAVLVGVALVVFLHKSRMGRAIRATAQNARAARVLGIDTDRVYATTFALNCAICGAAGGIVAMTWFVQPYLGLTYTLRSFMIVIAAGLGNLPGVIVAGSGLGVLEEFAGFVLGAEYQTAFIFIVLVVLLVGRNMVLARQRKYLA
ncbi:MAG TPA: branched-chain amino acid ABC transporter permease [Casimicrobiaceae bacterium]|jgi:branched-chain amino acid transport system permease protein|nr:branched-chain amino acid ABC transporter permease [Casimicrobiaceae bacterium]